MRLIAVPLARIRPGAPPVTTFLAQSSKAAKSATVPATAPTTLALKGGATGTGSTSSLEGEASLEGRSKSGKDESDDKAAKTKKLPLTTRAMNKASDFWVGLGREDQKSTFDWKKKTYNLGEKVMDQIEYEEWALKGVDPTFGPSIKANRTRSEEGVRLKEAHQDSKEAVDSNTSTDTLIKVPLLFPPSLLDPKRLLSHLEGMTARRQPHHWRRLIYCVAGMPLTIPFALIPVVPNLPFFYLVWRAWSHWRAYSSSHYLSELIKQGRLQPTPSQDLDRILTMEAPSASKEATPSSAEAEVKESPTAEGGEKEGKEEKEVDYEQYLLLKPHTITELVKSFNLEHQLSIELTRARQQTIKSIQKGVLKKIEEAAAEDISSPSTAK
ncbi:hypothetical protein CBS101457_006496 [Exobasidium rhododendri]|nr:hypothetical protein CBS101457_006496 [Exobasidium rhododendri]